MAPKIIYFKKSHDDKLKQIDDFFKESNVAIDDPNLELVYFAGLKYFYLDKNYQLGMKYLISAADRNHIESQIEVAKCYFMGEGVKKI